MLFAFSAGDLDFLYAGDASFAYHTLWRICIYSLWMESVYFMSSFYYVYIWNRTITVGLGSSLFLCFESLPCAHPVFMPSKTARFTFGMILDNA